MVVIKRSSKLNFKAGNVAISQGVSLKIEFLRDGIEEVDVSRVRWLFDK